MTQTGHVIPGTNYTVEDGDNLTSIAVSAYGNGADWPKIYEANKQVIGPNPNVLRVGEVLAIPTLSPTAGAIYIVQPGDSLTSIAQRAYHDGNQWPLIYNANKQVIGSNPNLVQPGEVLHIPASPSPSVNLPLRSSTEVQGDILAGFNKDHRVYLFLQFPDQAHGRAWLKELLPSIATTKSVADFNAAFSAAKAANHGADPPNLKATWVNVSLTIDGLSMLLNTNPRDALNGQGFTSFVAGPLQSADFNGDTGSSDPGHWVVGKPNQTIHALLNIQSDDPNALQAKIQEMQTLVNQHNLTLVFEQSGETLPDALRGHEHFGFKDGISQPGVLGFDPSDPHNTGQVLGHPGTEIIAAGEFILGLVPEPGSGGQPFSPPASSHLDWMNNGSFLVFRRLRQDVPGFVGQITSSLPADGSLNADMLGARVVGRWKSGTPVDLSPDKDNNLTDDGRINNFDFTDDDGGFHCPRFAHIRKVYPRQQDFAGNRARRVIRRGVPFGAPFNPAGGSGQDANAERGLLFIAYMSSIENKFEFLMQAWVNNPGFSQPNSSSGPEPGTDPIIGDLSLPCIMPRRARPNLELDFNGFVNTSGHRFVDTTGTVYAFAPSISNLNKIANGAF